MLVALKDLQYAKSRFLLIGLVVALLTVLVGFLTGLGKGLNHEGNQAIADSNAQNIAFKKPSGNSQLSFTDSQLKQQDIQEYQSSLGADHVQPVGLSMGKISKGANTDNVTMLGKNTIPTGKVDISEDTAKLLDVKAGDTVQIFSKDYIVDKVTPPSTFAFANAMTMNLTDWQQDAAITTGTPDVKASFLSIDDNQSIPTELQNKTNTVVKTKAESYDGISGYSAQASSFTMINSMLYGISALVMGAFFAVWTAQRKHDIAVLKALGASKGSLLIDALIQALIVLVAGIAVGTALTAIMGEMVSKVMPFTLNATTLGLPAIILLATGLLGAGLAVKSISKVDPLTALGSAR
ncbi:MAG: ABC transporter permease [Micrococcaceae bacterium]